MPLTDDPALLGRPELADALEPPLEALAGRVILITGAAGSLGQALARTLARSPRARLVLLDHHEHSLFSLQRTLAAEGEHGRQRFVLADVRDTRRLTQVVRGERPDIVFHFAAYKHVHYGEQFPEQSVAVNVLATRELLGLAAATGVERFVYPSSDKAVDPPSLYGATKRIAEVLVMAAAARGHAYTALRYVNVLGTLGSVLETFAAQLAAGRPLTVTDRGMARYWMSQREAIWLALHAAQAPAGSLLMLDGLVEVPLLETAARVAELHRLGPEYPIMVTGARPGERLREQLLGPHERAVPGPRAGLVRVEDALRAQHVARVEEMVDELAMLCDEAAEAQLRAAAMRAAHALQ